MNSADNLVAGRMVDSFVNVENVRLFTNEYYETERLDRGLAEYERAANQSRMSLLYLNLSQTLVVLVGVTAVLILAAQCRKWHINGWWIRDSQYLHPSSIPTTQFPGINLSPNQAIID